MSHPDADRPVGWPTEDDLADWARILLNDAYLQRPRIRCSREDFFTSAIATLLALGWKSAFRSDVELSNTLRRRWCRSPALVEAMVDTGPGATDEFATYLSRREARIDAARETDEGRVPHG